MERDDKTTLKGVVGKDFNSHAHVERDNVALKNSATQAISTHTLTWSVTHYFLIISSQIRISTHTLTWSVTIADIIAKHM